MIIELSKSTQPNKKYMVKIDKKTIHFGDSRYSDFTTNGGDKKKRDNYILRHSKRENWGKNGIKTAGFWAFWLLWNEDTIDNSIKDIEKRFNVDIKKL